MKVFIAIATIIFIVFILFRFENKVELFSENPYENYITKYSDYFGVPYL